MQLARLLPLARERRVNHLRHGAGRFVRRDGNQTVRAERHHRERQRVVARQHEKTAGPAAQNFHYLREVPRSLFDRDDVLDVAREAERRLRRDVRRRSPRHVVEHDGRRGHRFGDGAEVLIESLLRRLVVVRRDDEHRVRAHLGGLARLLDGVRGVVAPRSGDDARAPARDFNRRAYDRFALLARHRHALARRPARNEQAHAALYLPRDERAHALDVNRAVRFERRHKGRRAPAHPFTFHLPPPLSGGSPTVREGVPRLSSNSTCRRRKLR